MNACAGERREERAEDAGRPAKRCPRTPEAEAEEEMHAETVPRIQALRL